MENTRWISPQIPINNPVQIPPSEAGKPEGGAFWEESPLKLPQREIFFRPGDIFYSSVKPPEAVGLFPRNSG